MMILPTHRAANRSLDQQKDRSIVTPRWLNSEQAAQYLTVKRAAFSRAVRNGSLPEPSLALGPRMPRWDISDLDQAMKGRESFASSMDREINAYVEKIRKEGWKNRKTRSVGRKR